MREWWLIGSGSFDDAVACVDAADAAEIAYGTGRQVVHVREVEAPDVSPPLSNENPAASGMGTVKPECVLTADHIRQMMREDIEKHGGQNAWADHVGLNQSYVSLVLSGRQDPGNKIARLYYHRKVTRYEPHIE